MFDIENEGQVEEVEVGFFAVWLQIYKSILVNLFHKFSYLQYTNGECAKKVKDTHLHSKRDGR